MDAKTPKRYVLLLTEEWTLKQGQIRSNVRADSNNFLSPIGKTAVEAKVKEMFHM